MGIKQKIRYLKFFVITFMICIKIKFLSKILAYDILNLFLSFKKYE